MFRTVTQAEKWLCLSLATLLVSCGDDRTAGNGGTGSDFPIHPAVALVQMPDGAMVQASAWRLWSVSDDSLRYARELPDTVGGFALPDTGSWVVEAWASTSQAGNALGLRNLPLDSSFDRCLNWVGRNLSLTQPAAAILGACTEMGSPTVSSRGGTQEDPRAVAAFRLPSPSQPSSIVTDAGGKAYATRAWRLWKATQDTNGPWLLFRFAGYQAAQEDGSLETSGLKGTFVAEGWNQTPTDSLYRVPPMESGLEHALLATCLGTSARVAPRVCAEPLFEPTLYGDGPGQLRTPDLVVVFRLP